MVQFSGSTILGTLFIHLKKRQQGEDHYRKALALLQNLANHFPGVPAIRQNLVRTHDNLGFLLANLGKGSEAEDQHRKAQSIRQKLAAEFPHLPEYRQKKPSELEPEPKLVAAEKRYRDLLGSKGPKDVSTLLAQRDWGQLCLASPRRFDEGEAILIEVMEALRDRPVDDPIRAFTINLVGGCMMFRQKNDKASWRTFHSQSVFGGELLTQKKYADAERLLVAGYQGLKVRQAAIPAADQRRLLQAVERLVQLYEATDRKEEAAKWRKELETVQQAQKKLEKQP